MSYLKIIDNELNQEFKLGNFTTIGRLSENGIQLLDELVSKRHAVIFKKGDSYFLKDLGSKNGCFINDKQVFGVQAFKEGDIIRIGEIKLLFSLKSDHTTDTNKVILGKTTPTTTMLKRKMSGSDSGKFKPVKDLRSSEEIKGDYEKLRLLFSFFSKLVHIFNRDEMFSQVLSFISMNLAMERAAILEKIDNEWSIIALKSENKEDASSVRFSISESIIQEVEEGKNAVLSYDATIDSRFARAQSIIMQGVKSVIALPIIIRENVKYILYVDSLVSQGAFSKKDLEILTNLGGVLSILVENTLLVSDIKRETKKRAVFERLFSPNIVDMILKGKLNANMKPANKWITVMFLDIRNFMHITSDLKDNDVFKLLNEYFGLMVEIIFHYGGTLDKYIGDSIMAFWGAPVPLENSEFNALRAAKEMQDITASFSREFEKMTDKRFSVGIGLNSGNLMVGYLGSSKTLSYTVIGHDVNIASRLCNLAKEGEILLGQNTYQRIFDRTICAKRDAIHIKGVAKPQPVYKFLSFQ